MVTHWMLGPAHLNAKCLSFVAIERLNEVTMDRAGCSDKASMRRRKRRKFTWETIGNVEGFESTGTPRHQIRYRFEIFPVVEARQYDLREVKTIWEVQQPTSDGDDPPNHTAQLQRPSESWRGRGWGPFINLAPVA